MPLPVSVIIKTLNEEGKIAATIASARAALDAVGGEIIVADSGSSDATVRIAAGLGVVVARIEPPALPSCGIGPQLGYQHSRHPFLCLIDGDMILDPGFLPAALAFLDENPDMAGVTGHVEEMAVSNLEFARRVARQGQEKGVGTIDRMNGGGLYRRAAIEDVGYFSDRNLHAYEEFDLGARLRHAGWRLHRLDRRFVSHYGHTENSYRLLLRRWRSKYLFGIGELLRAALGRGHLPGLMRELPELKLWAAIYLWWAASVAALLFMRDKALAAALVCGVLVAVVLAMGARKGGLNMGLYTVVAWFFHAAALPVGFLRRRRDPAAPVESSIHRPPPSSHGE